MTKVDRPSARKYFDVIEYGALADGSTNDRAVIQTAIDDAVADGGGTVYFSKAGTYKVQITTSGWPGSTTLTYANAATHVGLTINGNNITLLGVPGAVLSFLPYGGDPDTHWYNTGEGTYQIWRGFGIWVIGGASSGAPRKNIKIEGLELDGNFAYTGNRSVSTSTGDGWDISHKGIALVGDHHYDGISVSKCHIHNFAGELFFGGGPNIKNWYVGYCNLHDSNGDGVSTSGGGTAEYNTMSTFAGSGIENSSLNDARQYILYNRVEDSLIDNITLIGAPPPTSLEDSYGGYDVIGNTTVGGARYGLGLINTRNTKVHHNTFIDGALVGGGLILEVNGTPATGTLRNIDISNNTYVADSLDVGTAIQIATALDYGTDISIHDERIMRTQNAIDGGFGFQQDVAVTANTNMSTIAVRNIVVQSGACIHGDTSALSCEESLLTTTSATVVASRKHNVNRLFVVSIWYRVITASTDVSIYLAYTDPNGDAHSLAIQASTSKSVGVYTVAPVVVACVRRVAAELSVTAGTVNQVYVTASIREA